MVVKSVWIEPCLVLFSGMKGKELILLILSVSECIFECLGELGGNGEKAEVSTREIDDAERLISTTESPSTKKRAQKTYA